MINEYHKKKWPHDMTEQIFLSNFQYRKPVFQRPFELTLVSKWWFFNTSEVTSPRVSCRCDFRGPSKATFLLRRKFHHEIHPQRQFVAVWRETWLKKSGSLALLLNSRSQFPSLCTCALSSHQFAQSCCIDNARNAGRIQATHVALQLVKAGTFQPHLKRNKNNYSLEQSRWSNTLCANSSEEREDNNGEVILKSPQLSEICFKSS